MWVWCNGTVFYKYLGGAPSGGSTTAWINPSPSSQPPVPGLSSRQNAGFGPFFSTCWFKRRTLALRLNLRSRQPLRLPRFLRAGSARPACGRAQVFMKLLGAWATGRGAAGTEDRRLVQQAAALRRAAYRRAAHRPRWAR